MLMAVHLYWAFHPACPSDRIDARSLGNHLTAFSASQGCQDFVPAASDKTVTSFADAGRLLRTESQVRFMLFMSYQTITVTPSFHTHALPLILRGILRLANFLPMAARSPARWKAQRLARHLAKCFAGANRVANFVALDVASRVANQLANVRASNFQLRVNRLSIVWLAARRQGRFALLPFDFHLDDARFAKDRMAIKVSRGKCHGH
jgi:hypothetical protein